MSHARRSAVVAWRAVLVAFALFSILSLAPVGVAQQTARAKTLGAKMLCACGCNQILTACNHVGCTYSRTMIKELDDRIARGDSDDAILQSFVQEYGLKVLAEPPTKGFNLAAWVVPIVAPLLAIFVVWELVRRWRGRAAMAVARGPDISAELLSRARHESGEDRNE
jgi:cytochrome c-type biogenesis protein CcmH/NrfF